VLALRGGSHSHSITHARSALAHDGSTSLDGVGACLYLVLRGCFIRGRCKNGGGVVI
jgi:hypothetical protein